MRTSSVTTAASVTSAPAPQPAYILEKRTRLNDLINQSNAGAYRSMSVSVDSFKGYDAYLKECCDRIEGCVLALGVPTAHQLVTTLTRVREGLALAQAGWGPVLTSRREELKMTNDLFETMAASYSTLKERNDSIERDLKMRMAEKDAESKALSEAAQYVLAVVKEHTAWQDRHGHNAQELPVEDKGFSDSYLAAQNALYAIRHEPAATAATLNRVSSMEADTTSAFAPRSRLYTNQVDKTHSLVTRWKSLEDARSSVANSAVRLHYIPPREEVELLRQVLAMGTASTTLMYDIKVEDARLERKKAALREEYSRRLEDLRVIKRELKLTKMFLLEAQGSRAPFLAYKADLLDALNRTLDAEVTKKIRGMAVGGAFTPTQRQQQQQHANEQDDLRDVESASDINSIDPTVAAYWAEHETEDSGEVSAPFRSPKDSLPPQRISLFSELNVN